MDNSKLASKAATSIIGVFIGYLAYAFVNYKGP